MVFLRCGWCRVNAYRMGIGKRHRIYEHPPVYFVQVYLMRDAYVSRKQEVLPGVETTAL